MNKYAIRSMFPILLMLLAACGTVSGQQDTETAIITTKPPPKSTSIQPTESSSSQELIGIGDARFSSQTFALASASIGSADVNNDGHLDLLNAAEPQFTVFLGDGRGVFTSFSHFPGGEQPDEFSLADLNGDSNMDIVVANHDTDYLTILLGDGQGKFQPASNSPLKIRVSPHPHVVKAADLDLDGNLDLVIDDRDAEGILILRGLGNGTFESPGNLIEVGGDPYRGMALGDINGDGLLDLVTPNPKDVGVLINESEDIINYFSASPVSADTPFAVELGDFNGDGELDLITASDEGSPLVEVFLGNGLGGFLPAEGSPYHFATGGKNIILGDFNGDQLKDAVIASYHHPDVLMLLGSRNTFRIGYLPGGEHPWGLVASDLNGDGKDDLVVADDGKKLATIYLSTSE